MAHHAWQLSLILLVPLVDGVVAAIETSQGKDFRYWLVGDWQVVREKPA